MPAPMPSNEPARAGPAAAGGLVCRTGSPATTLALGGGVMAVLGLWWTGVLARRWPPCSMPRRLLSGCDLSCCMALMIFGFGVDDEAAMAGVVAIAAPRIVAKRAVAEA